MRHAPLKALPSPRGWPLSFWIYVLAGVALIIVSAIAMPFFPIRRP